MNQTETERSATDIIRTLSAHGHQAYLVGGYVRDKLAGRPCKDIDISTSALPEEVMDLFARTVPTGLQHGTVTVVVERTPFEVTTFRKESEYEGHRRPKSVEFIPELREDLQRRDFTMNAMALDADGTLIDPFGGRKDLEAGRLACVGEPALRFREDALRMLRCIRFAAEYSLEVEAATWAALLVAKPLLKHIAMERVRSELEKTVEGRDPDRGLKLLAASGLYKHFKSSLPLDAELAAIMEHPLPDGAYGRLALDAAEARWALLCLRLRLAPAPAANALRAFTFSARKIALVQGILGFHEALQSGLAAAGDGAGTAASSAHSACAADSAAQVEPEQEASLQAAAELWKRCCLQHGVAAAHGWLAVLQAITAAEMSALLAPAGEARAAAQPLRAAGLWAAHGRAWAAELPAASLRELAVRGGDIVALVPGQGAGPWVRALLERLLLDAALGRVANEREALLRHAEQYIRESVEGDGISS